jgi:orotate phosphoribosyltransferase
VTGRRVLLVDDVTTTGATVTAAARALRAAGAAGVEVVVAARTPPAYGHVQSAMAVNTDGSDVEVAGWR